MVSGTGVAPRGAGRPMKPMVPSNWDPLKTDEGRRQPLADDGLPFLS
jgi:hypothetical protein